MKSVLNIPKFSSNETLNGDRLDSCIRMLYEYVNGGLTSGNLAASPATTLANNKFYEASSTYTVTIPISTNASNPVTFSSALNHPIAFGVNVASRLVSFSYAFRVTVSSGDPILFAMLLAANPSGELDFKTTQVKLQKIDRIPDKTSGGWTSGANIYAGTQGNAWYIGTITPDRKANCCSAGSALGVSISSASSITYAGAVSFTLSTLHIT